jgi:hypothetical protein
VEKMDKAKMCDILIAYLQNKIRSEGVAFVSLRRDMTTAAKSANALADEGEKIAEMLIKRALEAEFPTKTEPGRTMLVKSSR